MGSPEYSRCAEYGGVLSSVLEAGYPSSDVEGNLGDSGDDKGGHEESRRSRAEGTCSYLERSTVRAEDDL